MMTGGPNGSYHLDMMEEVIHFVSAKKMGKFIMFLKMMRTRVEMCRFNY